MTERGLKVVNSFREWVTTEWLIKLLQAVHISVLIEWFLKDGWIVHWGSGTERLFEVVYFIPRQ